MRRHIASSVRTGLASLEAVLVTGIVVPGAVALMWLGINASKLFYQLVANLVCWPYM